jgi:hypothetical protein
VLKNDKLKDKEKKKDTEALLGSIADERFALLTNLGKKITDFNSESTLPTSGTFVVCRLGNLRRFTLFCLGSISL